MHFEEYKVIVIPDSFKMNEAAEAKLSEYLKNGGKVLSSGTAGLDSSQKRFALKEWDFKFEGIDLANASYYSFVSNNDEKLSDMPYCMYSDSGILIKKENAIAKYVKSYFNFEWDGIHGYSYTPPDKETGNAVAALNDLGNVCHISFDVFNSYFKSAAYAQKALVAQCLDVLLPNPLIKTEEIPSTSRVTLTGNDDYVLLHVKVSYPELRGNISVIEEHGMLDGGMVHVKGSYKSAFLLPDKTPIDIRTSQVFEGYTSIKLPKITGYQMLYLGKH